MKKGAARKAGKKGKIESVEAKIVSLIKGRVKERRKTGMMKTWRHEKKKGEKEEGMEKNKVERMHKTID